MTTLLEIYAAFLGGKLDHDEAAKAFDITPDELRRRIIASGFRLPMILSLLDRIRVNEITREKAAEILHIDVRQINRFMGRWKIKRTAAVSLVKVTAAAIKWEIRKKYAIEYIAGAMTFEEAADMASVGTRQMRRWVEDLLQKHLSLTSMGLKTLTATQRMQLAQAIEEGEGLDQEKARVLYEVALGRRTLKDEAMARIHEHKKLKAA